MKLKGGNSGFRVVKVILLLGTALAYSIWVFSGPLQKLNSAYGESGLMWAILVYFLLIPYCAYILFDIFFKKWGK